MSQLWDLDNDGAFDDASGATAMRSFPAPGNYTVKLRVADGGGAISTVSHTVTVQNRSPVAWFTYSPTAPQTGQTITLTSASNDPDGSIKSQAWDLDNDGQYDDGNSPTVQTSFGTVGSHTVRLQVKDDRGAVSATYRNVVVGNRPPVASFEFLPASPIQGDTVTFFSTASDPDGPLQSQAWDLDNDGLFDDATGATATRSFLLPGNYTVGLQVTDSLGAAAVSTRTVTVLVPGTASTSGLRLLSPFPIVRIAGTVTTAGARLRRLTITAPPGVSILVRCVGRGCPLKRYSRARVSSLIRVHRLERHLLRTGARIEIFIRKPGMIGKYTRFRIRSGKEPARLDRCLLPGGRRPIRCPA